MPSSACDWSSDVCSSDRSEEHTSELQSRSDLVCRLLLEKKKEHLCTPVMVTEAKRYTDGETLAELLAGMFAERGKDAWESELLENDVASVALTTTPLRQC